MKKILTIIFLVVTVVSCKEKPNREMNKQNMNVGFTSRIHTTELETDLYKILGETSLEKHITDFGKIDWKKDYWSEYESGNFNMTDLEVLSVNDSRYLSISTSPNTDDTFQFIIGFGTHTETNNPEKPNRNIKLYMTESENMEIPQKFINLFFQKDFNKINGELKELSFMDEIEDLYNNIE